MTEMNITWPGHQNTPSATGRSASDIKPEPAIILADEGKHLKAFGDEILVHLGGAETGGQYTVFTCITPPGGGPPPHYHADEDEWFYPLEGKVEFFLEGVWRDVPLRTLIFVPRGTVHTFRNCGETPLRLLTHTSPAGFETFFARCAAEFAKSGPPDMERIIAISAEHGIFFVTD